MSAGPLVVRPRSDRTEGSAPAVPNGGPGNTGVLRGGRRSFATLSGLAEGTSGAAVVNPSGVTRVLGVVLASLVVASAIVVATGMATGRSKYVVFGGIAVALYLALWLLVRKVRHVAALSGAAAGGSTAIVVLLMVSGNGLHDISVVLLPVPVLIASLLLSATWCTVVVGLVVFATSVVGVSEVTGALSTPMSGHTGPEDVIVVAVALLALAVMSRAVVRSMYAGFRAARESERSYREVFDGTSEAIFIHDKQSGRILDVNRTGTAMFGYSRPELLSMGLTDLGDVGDDNEPLNLMALLRRAAEEGHVTFEWRGRTRDGRRFWVESALRSSEIGGQPCVLGAVRDVDDRHRLEETLTQAEKLQAVGQLAGGVAHDFNNQLTGIIAGAELLKRRTKEDSVAVEYADIILQASRRSADLVGNLLAFARKAKRQDVEVDVCTVVEEVVGLLERSIDRRIDVRVKLPPERARVQGDPTLLSNAVLNLGLNARDAMPTGGTLSFVVEQVDKSALADKVDAPETDRIVRVAVTDTGGGMDALTVQRIFEPFFTTKESGTGMGLSAVYGTTKSHGGTVRVQTRPGEGTTFELLMPAVVPASIPERPGSSPTASPNELELAVLVAEDEETVLAATRAMLDALGCRVIVAKNGREAVESFRSHPDIDVVLLDRMMPVLTGDAALTEIRKADPEARVILASGYADLPIDTAEIHEQVVTLQKPYTLGQLEQALREALCNHPP